MSRLGEYENDIVDRLETAAIGGTAAFEIVTGASGGWRGAHREAIFRERIPAAYVAFIEEPCAPEVRVEIRGAKFVVLIAARALRVESNPRHGDASSTGAFALIDAARTVLDDHELDTNLRLVCVHVRFVEADDRAAVYELLYRVWPVVEEPRATLEFDGDELGGSKCRLAMEVGSLNADVLEFTHHHGGAVYKKTLDPLTRIILWRGELRADSHGDMNDIDDDIETHIASITTATVEEVGVRSFSGCNLIAYFRAGGRKIVQGDIVQAVEILFMQKL